MVTKTSNLENLKKLTREEKLELIGKHPVRINGKIEGFLWSTGEVGSYIPIILKNKKMEIDWTQVNILAISNS